METPSPVSRGARRRSTNAKGSWRGARIPSEKFGTENGCSWGRLHVAAQQAAHTLPWTGTDDPVEEQRPQVEHSKMLADLWYIDDGDILCHPTHWYRLICKRSTQPMQTLELSETHGRHKSPGCCTARMESLFVSLSPRWAVGVTHWELQWDPEFIADSHLAEADVIRAMHSARVLVSVESTTSSKCTVTQFFKRERDEPPKSSMKEEAADEFGFGSHSG